MGLAPRGAPGVVPLSKRAHAGAAAHRATLCRPLLRRVVHTNVRGWSVVDIKGIVIFQLCGALAQVRFMFQSIRGGRVCLAPEAHTFEGRRER